jgi:hypothetical protein
METRSNDQDSNPNDCGGLNGHVYLAQISKESEGIYKKTKRQRKRQQNSKYLHTVILFGCILFLVIHCGKSNNFQL